MGKSGKTPLQSAIINGKLELVKFLIKNGGDVEVKSKSGDTSIHIATLHSPEILEYFLKNGADPNILNSGGFTPLIYSAADTYLTLVQHGLDKRFRQKKFIKVKLLPTVIDDEDIAELETLCKKGVDVNLQLDDGSIPLHEAARRNFAEVIKILVKYGSKLNIKNGFGDTPLHKACWYNGQPESVEALLIAGADPEIPNKIGETPFKSTISMKIKNLLKKYNAKIPVSDLSLYECAGLGYPEELKSYFIYANGEYLDFLDHEGRTPLHQAAMFGHYECARLLIKNGAKLNLFTDGGYGQYPIHLAAAGGYLKIVKLLVDAGVKVDLECKGAFQQPAIFKAAEFGHCDVIQYFLDKKVDIDIQNNRGNTPLHIATRNGKLDVVKLLVKKGADLCIDNCVQYGGTPLHLAARSVNLEVVKFLVKNDAPLEAVDNQGRTPLFSAIEAGRIDMIKLLLELGANPSRKNPKRNGLTPLHSSMISNNPAIVSELIKYGADVALRDSMGNTPLHYMVSSHRDQCLEVMLKSGAMINARNIKGETPLHIAVMTNSVYIVKNLLKNKADPTLKNLFGKTPIDYANSEEMKQILLKKQ